MAYHANQLPAHSIFFFSASQAYLNLLKKKKEYDRYTQESQHLIEELAGSPNYKKLNYHILENLLTTSLECIECVSFMVYGALEKKSISQSCIFFWRCYDIF